MEYFSRRPVGWREDHRTHYTLAAQGVKAKPEELFGSLRAIMKDREESINESTEGDAERLLASPLFAKMMSDTNWEVDVK